MVNQNFQSPADVRYLLRLVDCRQFEPLGKGNYLLQIARTPRISAPSPAVTDVHSILKMLPRIVSLLSRGASGPRINPCLPGWLRQTGWIVCRKVGQTSNRRPTN